MPLVCTVAITEVKTVNVMVNLTWVIRCKKIDMNLTAFDFRIIKKELKYSKTSIDDHL